MKARDSVLTLLLLLSSPALAATTPAPAAPLDSTQLAVQARAAMARGEVDLALRLAQSAIVADPSRPSSYDVLGDVYAANHQPDYARNYYEEALSIDPTDPTATKAIASLDRAGDTRKADASADGAKPGIP
jgi:Flp pilus assembly protein TadD